MRLLALRAETMQAMRRLKLPCDDITPIGLWGSDMYLIGVNNDQFEVLRLWNVQTEDITPATLRDFHTEEPAIPTTPSAGKSASDARSSAMEGSSGTASKSVQSSPPVPRPASKPVASEPPPVQSRTGASAPAASTASSSRDRETTSPAKVDIAPPIAAVAHAAAVEAPTLVRSEPSGGETGRGNGSAGPPAPSDRRDGPSLTLESNTGGVTRGDEPAAAKRGKSARGDTEARPAPPMREKEKVPAQEKESSAGKLRMTVDGEHLYAEIKGGKIVLKDRTYDSLAHARDSIRRERNKVAVWEYFDEGVKAWRVLNRD